MQFDRAVIIDRQPAIMAQTHLMHGHHHEVFQLRKAGAIRAIAIAKPLIFIDLQHQPAAQLFGIAGLELMRFWPVIKGCGNHGEEHFMLFWAS